MILDASYDLKTIEELQAEFVQLAADLSVITDKRAAILALMTKRKAEAKAAAQIASLDPIERDALKRALESRNPQS